MATIFTDLLIGRDDLSKRLEYIESEIARISKVVVNIKSDSKQVDELLEKLRSLKKDASNVVVKATTNFSEVNSEIVNLEKKAKQLQKAIETKVRLGLDATQSINELDRVTAKIDALKETRAKLGLDIKDAQANVERLQKLIDSNLGRKEELKLELGKAQEELSQLVEKSNLLNETLGRIPSTAQVISNSFSRLSTIFGNLSRWNPFASVFKIARGTVISRLTTALMGNISGGIERYDIIKSFKTIVPQLLNVKNGAKLAENAINQLDESVQGLPTGLDEIVDSAKRFISATGDIQKGTRLAIAVNRAFLASGADTQQIYYGTKQIQDLLSAGKLRTQEWESLEKAMPLAMRKIGEAMGYAGDKYGEFRSKLKSGQITADEFLTTIEELGNEGGVLYNLAENYKDFMSSVISNISIALKRGYQGILETLDAIFLEETGEGLAKNLTKIKYGLNDIFDSIKAYLVEHKEDVIELWNVLGDIDYKEVLKGALTYLKYWGMFAKGVIELASEHPKFTRFALSILTMSGVLSKFFGALSNVFGRFGNRGTGGGLFGGLMQGLFGKGNKPTTTATGVDSLVPILRKLIIAGAMIGGAELALYGLAKVAQELKKIGKMDWVTIGENLLNMSSVIGIVVILMQKLGEISGVKGLKNTFIGTLIALMGELAIFFSGKSFSSFATGVNDLVRTFERLSNNQIEFDSILDDIKNMKTVFDELMRLVHPDNQAGQTVSEWSILQGSIDTMSRVIASMLVITTSISTINNNMASVNTDNFNKIGTAISNLKNSLESENMSGLFGKAVQLKLISTVVASSMKLLNRSAKLASGAKGFGGLKNTIEACITAIEKLNGLSPVVTEIKVKDKYSKPIANFISDMNKARQQTNITRTITVNRVTNNNNIFTRRRYNPITKEWEYFSKGGFVKPQYRANGGSIFKARGTDRVPAMLTAGEFVIKRSAVQGLGTGILHKLNNLDLTGALKDLSIRAGANTSNNYSRSNSTVNNDNRRTNKITVNQNIRDGKSAPFKAGKALRSI